jgi:Tfp pilus assembly protein PilF
LMYAKLNQEEKAKQIYKAVIELNDSHVDALVALGVYALNEDKGEEALEYLNKAIGESSEYGDAYKIRAIIHSFLANNKEALLDIGKALEISNDDSELWQQKIAIYEKENNVVEASKAFKAWVELAPDQTARYAAYGEFFVENEDYKSAEDQFSFAIELEIYGEFAAINSFSNRGWARLKQGKMAEAIEDFNKVIELDAKRAEPYIGMAEARVQEGAVDAAITYLDLGVDIVLHEGWMLTNKKGAIQVGASNWEGATFSFQTLIDMEDEEVQAEGYFGMGKMHQAKGDLEAAFRAWRKASDIFHLEADECIYEFCEEFLAIELQEKENTLLVDMLDDFEENKKSKMLGNFFGKFWKADIKTTGAKNEMFAKLPDEMKRQVLGLLKNICIAVEPKGIMVLNPGFDGVRMVYAIDQESSSSVTIGGIPLNGTGKKEFTFLLNGSHMVIKGLGDEDADIALYLEPVDSSDELEGIAKKDLKEHASHGNLEFMGEDFLAKIK